jgi:hypothetical protein
MESVYRAFSVGFGDNHDSLICCHSFEDTARSFFWAYGEV